MVILKMLMEKWRKILSISWQEHRTNDSILTELGLERELMGRVAKLKLQYFGHITRGSAGQLALTVLEGIMEGLRHQVRPRRQWIHDIEEWTGCEYLISFFSIVLDLVTTRSSTMEKKDIRVVICCRQLSSRKVD